MLDDTGPAFQQNVDNPPAHLTGTVTMMTESSPRGTVKRAIRGRKWMSDFAQYPYEALQAVGGNLTDISEQIGSKSRNAFEIIGFTSDQDRINSALDHFRSEWEASVKKLGDNIGGFGDTSTQIGTMAGQTDAELAEAMSQGRSGGSAGQRGGGLPV
jgi:hypothetical protein